MPKLCPNHQQPYRDGVCPLCEQRGGGAVDWKAECRRLNAEVERLRDGHEQLAEDWEAYRRAAEQVEVERDTLRRRLEQAGDWLTYLTAHDLAGNCRWCGYSVCDENACTAHKARAFLAAGPAPAGIAGGEGECPRCHQQKIKDGTECPGCDDCPHDDKRPCPGWSGYCCDCGAEYAKGQM